MELNLIGYKKNSFCIELFPKIKWESSDVSWKEDKK